MLERRISPTGIVFYASALMERAGIHHAFSTRIGGISPAPFDSLNLGNPSGCERQDDDERIQENYRLLQRAMDCEARVRCWVHQTHGNAVEDAGSGDFENGRKADALVTTCSGQILAIRTADCVPILIAGSDGAAVGAVHAGWRGVICGVIPAAIETLRKICPARQPKNLIAAIGPCIGPDAFEVGPEVVAEFRRTFGDGAPVRVSGAEKGHVDLVEACRRQLLGCGVPLEHIDWTDRCTYRESDEFFSHRRDNGITGRMAALIAPRS